ncbi:MAG: hypothetical protein LBR10_07390 [Prevotellaceae bacterium]|jgi:predicted Zn-dependent protease|nr:hypothetical protein [Prevotellaceae bacterium]
MQLKYKYNLMIAVFLLCTGMIFAQQTENVILSAIQKEVDRNKAELKIDKLKPPFFISYTIFDFKGIEVAASLGALSHSIEYNNRGGKPSLLVGDYNRNNSNYNIRNYVKSVSLENDPKGIAIAIWEDLDKVYKNSAEAYESKLAAIAQQKLEEDEANLLDLEQTPPITLILEKEKVNLDKNYWDNYAKKASEIVKKYPEIISSGVNILVRDAMIYIYNTENTQIAIPAPYYRLQFSISTVTEDGQELSDHLYIEHSTFEQIPELQKFIDSCELIIKDFIALRNAPLIQEAYSGPVLFEGMAVAEAFHTHFFNNQTLNARRKAVGGYGGNNTEMMKDKKLISRSLTIKSLSGTETYKGKKLDGYFPVDAEGVVPDKELLLVENGVLRNMLNGRTPTKKFQHSNGHAKFNFNSYSVATAPGNILFTSNDTYSIDELKKKLLAAAKEEDFEYAYIVRRYRNNNPLAVYKIYVEDGREELVRGVSLPDLNTKSFKRVLGASNRELFHTACYFGSFTTYIVPGAFLFEELEVTRNNNITFKTPFIVPKPATN